MSLCFSIHTFFFAGKNPTILKAAKCTLHYTFTAKLLPHVKCVYMTFSVWMHMHPYTLESGGASN